MISKQEYKNYAEEGFNILPIVKDLKISSESPISLFEKIKNKENSFLLESVEGGEKWAQYSIIGIDCSDSIKVIDKTIEIKEDGQKRSFESNDPLNEISKIIEKYNTPEIKNMPRFYGGYVGFFAYESAKYAEKKIEILEKKDSKFKEHMPEIYLVKANKLIVFDNFNKKQFAVFNANPTKISYEESLNSLNKIESYIDQELIHGETAFETVTGKIEFNSNFTKDDFIQAVKTIKEYIKEGDVMQVVLAQDFSLPFSSDPFKLYAALRALNPSPYMYYLNLSECKVVGASPEILIRLEEDKITLRPIAGTRKRGNNKNEDELNEIDLLNDPKELAEHLMLIDLH